MSRLSTGVLSALFLVGCGTSNAGRTLVYEVDGTTRGMTDPSLCAQGVGAEIDLMVEEGIAFAVDTLGRSALLATCSIDGGEVGTCGLLPPLTELALQGERAIGSGVGRVELPDSACLGANIQVSWDILLEGDQAFVDARAVWQLDPTQACDALEGEVRAADPQGRGVNGCIVQYAFEARQIASCAYAIDAQGNLTSGRAEPCRY